MIKKTKDRWLAVEALLQLMLKDRNLYCNTCGQSFKTNKLKQVAKSPLFPCCNFPQVGDHATHIRAIAKENQMLKETRLNQFAATKDKTMRLGVSIPAVIYDILNKSMMRLYNEKLFRDNKDTNIFAKKFKQFAVPERI